MQKFTIYGNDIVTLNGKQYVRFETHEAPTTTKTSRSKRERWTTNDDSLLLSLKAGGKSNAEVAKSLGRSEGAVSVRYSNIRQQNGVSAT